MISYLWLGSSLTLALLCVIISMIFFIQSRKSKDIKKLKKYTFGIGIFMFFIGFNGILDFSAMYSLTVLGRGTLLPDQYQFITAGQDYFYIMISILMISFSALSYQIETHIKNAKKHTLTAILLACLAISIVPYFGSRIPAEYHQYIMYVVYSCLIPFGLIIIYWAMFYIKIIVTTAGIVRKKASLVAFGLGAFFIGIVAEIVFRSASPINYAILFACKIMSLIGICMLAVGFKN